MIQKFTNYPGYPDRKDNNNDGKSGLQLGYNTKLRGYAPRHSAMQNNAHIKRLLFVRLGPLFPFLFLRPSLLMLLRGRWCLLPLLWLQWLALLLCLLLLARCWPLLRICLWLALHLPRL